MLPSLNQPSGRCNFSSFALLISEAGHCPRMRHSSRLWGKDNDNGAFHISSPSVYSSSSLSPPLPYFTISSSSRIFRSANRWNEICRRILESWAWFMCPPLWQEEGRGGELSEERFAQEGLRIRSVRKNRGGGETRQTAHLLPLLLPASSTKSCK